MFQSFYLSVLVRVMDWIWGEILRRSINGDTPYALSKIQAEEYLTDCVPEQVTWDYSPFTDCGPNPPGNLGDMIRA